MRECLKQLDNVVMGMSRSVNVPPDGRSDDAS